MHKVNTLACYNRRVLSLLTRKQVPRVSCFSAMVISLPLSKTARITYNTVLPPFITAKQHVYTAVLQKHFTTCTSTDIVAQPSDADVMLTRKIMVTITVQGQLELFKAVQDSAGTVHKVAFLFNIAKIIVKNEMQQQVLEQEKELSKQGKGSTYLDLLECIAEIINNCQCRHLANVMWALGKVKEKDHRLIQVCMHEILHRDVSSFNYVEVLQIVNGCANLDLKAPEIFSNFQEAILAQKLRSKGLEDQEMAGILQAYAKTNNGSKELFDHFLKEIASRNMMINSRALADVVWSFAKTTCNTDSDSLFNLIEGEIVRRGAFDFENPDIVKILWAFSMAGKGSIRLFALLESKLISRGMNTFLNVELVEVLWSFGRSNVRNARVFDVAESEILNRGASGFKTHELVLILYSFVTAKRDSANVDFIKQIEAELSLRNTNELDISDWGQVIWSLGRAGISDSKFFDLAEAEVLSCNMQKVSRTQKCMLMRGFIEAQRGSKELYQHLHSSISSRDLSNLTETQICEFAWCFSLANVEAGKLFDFLEKEILNRGRYHFTKKQLRVILKSFLRAGKYSKRLQDFVTQH